MAVIVADDFNRSDRSLTGETAPSGQTWETPSGTWVIQSNRATNTAGSNGTCLINTGQTDYEVTATINFVSGTNLPGLVFAAANDGSRLGIFLDTSGNELELWKSEQGTSYQQASATLDPGIDYTVRVRFVDGLVEAYLDGGATPTLTYALNSTERATYLDGTHTKVGFRGRSLYDGLSVDNLAAAVVTGTASVDLGAVSVTAVGTVIPEVVPGVAVVALGGLSVAATGTRTTSGTAAVALGSLAVAATGTVVAEVVSGAVSVALGALSVAASGTRTTHGTAALDLGPLAVTAVGTAVGGVVTGSATVALAGLAVSATGTRTVRGTVAVALGPLDVEAVGTAVGGVVTGTAAVDLGGLDLAAIGQSRRPSLRAGTPIAVRGLVADISTLSPPQLSGPGVPLLVARGSSQRTLAGPGAPLLVAGGSSRRALRGPQVPALSAP